MANKLINEIDLFLISTLEPTFEPSFEPSIMPYFNNTITKSSYDSLNNDEKRIIIFSLLGFMISLFMGIAIFFHLKSKYINKTNINKEEKIISDLLSDDISVIIVEKNEIKV